MNRLRSFCLVLAAVAALSSVAAGSAPARVPQAPNDFLGITPATRLSGLELARMSLGKVPTLRVPFFWEDIQPYPGQGYQFTRYDELVAYAAYYGILIKPFVEGVPSYLGRRVDAKYPPVQSKIFMREWGQMLRALVQRYGPGGELWQYLRANAPQIKAQPIRTWQIWNEPNGSTYWHPQRTAPETYARLLKASSRVIRGQDRGARIVVAGFFEHPSDGTPMTRFVSRLYDVRGITSSFDAIGIHPYSVNAAGVADQIRAARAVMDAAGDSETELWVDEVGWPTQARSGNNAFLKSEAGQKQSLRRTFTMILRKRQAWNIGSLIWYTWADTDVFTTCDLCGYSGLFREDLTAKPAWGAYVDFTGGVAEPPQRALSAPQPIPLPGD